MKILPWKWRDGRGVVAGLEFSEIGGLPKLWGVLICIRIMQPSPVLIYRWVEIFEKSEERGWRFSCKNGGVIHIWWVFHGNWEYALVYFLMVYGLSNNNFLYSTSNQILYVNKNVLHFLNLKQQFSFMSWFLCLSHASMGKKCQKRGDVQAA